MKKDEQSGANRSYWTDSASHLFLFPKLTTDLTTDVVVIGGGITGISVAYCLAREGYKVIVVEDGQIGSGETGRTTAQLVNSVDDSYTHIQSVWGPEKTRLIAESHRSAIDFIEQNVRELGIDCFFERVSAYLMTHPTDTDQSIEKEYEATLDAGLDVRLLEMVPGILQPKGPCLEFKDQAQFHPLLYIRALCDVILNLGGQLFTYTHASEIESDHIITSDGHRINANDVVVATNSPVHQLVLPHIKQIPYRTYLIGALVPRNTIEKALWWDTGDQEVEGAFAPYHFVRLQAYDQQSDLLLCGGEDHPVGDLQGIFPEERYARLENWTRQFFPIDSVIYTWSGQVLQSMDSIAYIGKTPMGSKHIYLSTGDSGSGMTHGTIAGMLITDLIAGRQNPYAEIYNPGRISIHTAGLVAKEFLSGISTLWSVDKEHEKATSLEEIKSGEAKLITHNGHLCGAFRNENGQLQLVGARCPHLKAILKWNPDEKTWDCQWHGSRFKSDGTVINGPSNMNLKLYSE